MKKLLSVLAVVSMTLVLTACNSTSTEETGSTKTTTTDVSIITEESTVEGYELHSAFNFDFYYPENWTLELGTDGTEVSVLSELDDADDIFSENCNVVIDSAAPEYELKDYYSLSVEQLPEFVSDFEMIEEGTIEFANADALYLAYNGTLALGDFFEDAPDDEYELSWLQYIAKPYDDVYIITCTAEADTFDMYVDQFDLIASYFEITE